jgi:hypothetical protein
LIGVLTLLFSAGCVLREGVTGGERILFGPAQPPTMSVRLGQSLVKVNGIVGPTDSSRGSPAIWEGQAASLEQDAAHNRTLFFFVEGGHLERVTLQVDDQEPIVEERPGPYLSGEISMVRWAQEYSLRVTAEDDLGNRTSSAIFVNGYDARIDGSTEEPPVRVRMLRHGPTETREVRGTGYRGRLQSHRWEACTTACDASAPGGSLVAFVTGPLDTLLLLFEGKHPYVASGLGSAPVTPHYVMVTIPVRDESSLELATISARGDLVTGRWSRPPS